MWLKGVIHKIKRNETLGNLLSILTDLLRNRKQRVILIVESSSRVNINAGVPQGSILGPLLCLIYIYNLSNNLQYSPKLFADDMSLISTVKVPERAANNPNNDFKKINRWPFRWKMTFNSDPKNQPQEVNFGRKNTKTIYPKILFNNILVSKVDSQKHLGLHFDSKLSFGINIKTILTKEERTIGLFRTFQQLLPTPSLISVYNNFIRPQLDYGDNAFGQASNYFFHQILESIQYTAALATTGAIRGISTEKFYQEPGFQTLKSRK